MGIQLELEQAIAACLTARDELQDVIDKAETPGDDDALEVVGYEQRIQACRDGVRLVSQILRRLGHEARVVITETETEEVLAPEPEVAERVEDQLNMRLTMKFDMEKVPAILRKEAEEWERQGHGDPQDFLFQRLQDLGNCLLSSAGRFGSLSSRDTARQHETLHAALYKVADRVAVEIPG